jgi:membrane-anchored protein YejM (alkaline phosphatase superfamily)
VFVAIVLGLASRLVLVTDVLVPDLVLLAVLGAVFSLLAFDDEGVRPGRALTLLAIAVAVFVVLGSTWMAGRWGGPV